VSLLTRREAAELSGASLAAVNKAIEQKVLRTRRRAGRTLLSPEEVGALAVLAETRVALPVAVKKRVAAWARSTPGANSELRLDGALVVRTGAKVEEAVGRARRYVELRERLIEVDPDVRGGAPVIKGTRVPVRGLARQIEGGETRAVLREEFSYMPEEAFELAPLWARANPRQGRPRRPSVGDDSSRATKASAGARAA
jgi:uncharacterized protein (DUF433 family)